jgi:hypothetical protein
MNETDNKIIKNKTVFNNLFQAPRELPLFFSVIAGRSRAPEHGRSTQINKI